MVLLKGTRKQYVVGFTQTPNRALGVSAAAAAIARIAKDSRDAFIKLKDSHTHVDFFEDVKKEVPEGVKFVYLAL